MIPKGSEIKLNVRPIFIGLVHEASYEGPCRFGEGKTLEVGYDRFLNPEMFKQFVKSCEDNIPDCAQIVDPLMVERTDNWDSPEAMFEAMIGDRENIDLYLFSAGMGRADIMIDFALRYHVPVALNPASNFGSGSNAALYYRGIETYTEFSWDDMRSRMRALQARKAIRKTRVMSLPRFQTAYSAGDSFIDLNKITQKFGTVFRSRNLHEFLDQMTPAVEGGNPTTPGRVTWDIDDNDEVEIERIARELVENADEVDIKPEYVRSAVVPYVLAKK